ncbi:cupin domain-containing protein [Galbibacter sp.]|jgi:quercetin dioxygenase-like cupin family protein|uniref:cupin domain-containing protein n=1 Tax=Galbibacter sp. TaxID=2918471 RepID=UPI003A8D195C
MINTSESFFIAKKNIWEPVSHGISRQITGYNDNIMMVKVKFDKGAIGELHQHPHTQSSYVISGVFEITIDGQKQRLESGDTFLVNPDLIHGALCLEAGILLDVFNPIREDFLE